MRMISMILPSIRKEFLQPNIDIRYWQTIVTTKDSPHPEMNMPKAVPLLFTNQLVKIAMLGTKPARDPDCHHSPRTKAIDKASGKWGNETINPNIDRKDKSSISPAPPKFVENRYIEYSEGVTHAIDQNLAGKRNSNNYPPVEKRGTVSRFPHWLLHYPSKVGAVAHLAEAKWAALSKSFDDILAPLSSCYQSDETRCVKS
jgi:hypothetical protein